MWVTGGADEGFADEGVLTGTDTKGRLGRGLAPPELVEVGLALAEPLVSQAVGVGVGEPLAVSDAEGSDVAPDGSAALGEPPADGVSVADEVGESVGLAESLGVGEPVHGFAGASVDAIPGLAGTTSSAPSATVPVAITPTTDAADRFLRVCFGTVTNPQLSPFSVQFGSCARRTHRPTVTNDPESGHPFGSGRITPACH